MLGEYLEATTSFCVLLFSWPQGRVVGIEYPNFKTPKSSDVADHF
jgi:hypothetical protein